MKKIVIIGGGFTGAYCARMLEKERNFEVTLIDNKDYFEFTPSVLRTILEPEHEMKIQALHRDYLKKARIVNDKVVKISEKEVVTKKEKFEFDYLIVSSGSSYNSPIKEEGLIPAMRAKELAMYHDKLEKSGKVLIIGGGLVGVELAAEICTHYKDKEITLVHSRDELIERNFIKARRYVKKFLEKRGVKLVLGERVTGKLRNQGAFDKRTKKINEEWHEFVTNKKTKIETDMVFICTGIRTNSEFMQKNFRKFLNEKKQVKVNKYLQLDGLKNVFVGGDITYLKEEKTAQTAENHAGVIVRNIKNLEDSKQLVPYKPKRKPIVISLGKYDGVFDNGKMAFGGFIPAFLKAAVEWKTMRKFK